MTHEFHETLLPIGLRLRRAGFNMFGDTSLQLQVLQLRPCALTLCQFPRGAPKKKNTRTQRGGAAWGGFPPSQTFRRSLRGAKGPEPRIRRQQPRQHVLGEVRHVVASTARVPPSGAGGRGPGAQNGWSRRPSGGREAVGSVAIEDGVEGEVLFHAKHRPSVLARGRFRNVEWSLLASCWSGVK